MNVLLWILQFFLAFHTLAGALWKFSTGVQAVPSLTMIPPVGWMALSLIEIVVGLLLVLPILVKKLGKYVPAAALFIVAEMLLFTGLHLISGAEDRTSIMYWLVVAAFSGFIFYGRTKMNPLSLKF